MNKDAMQTLMSSENQGWETPEGFLDRIRQAYGEIGLDPASTSSNPTRANSFYTPKDNGLVQEWGGKGIVFCNPPYGRELRAWIAKAALEASKGVEIIMLIPARTDTRAFQDDILGVASVVCLWKGRLTFKGADHPAPFPSAVVYWGTDEDRFMRAFAGEGKFVRSAYPGVSVTR